MQILRKPKTICTSNKQHENHVNFAIKLHQKLENQSSLSTSTSSTTTTTSESDEAVLLRDWEFDRFFPTNSNRNSKNQQQQNHDIATANANNSSPAFREKSKNDDYNNKLKLEDRVKSEIFANNSKANNSFLNNLKSNNKSNDAKGHKRQDSDSKISLNFVRGFRRENSDFFPLSKRHSAVLGERSPNPSINVNPAPQRSSAIFQRNKSKGEPVLTDFVSTNRDFATDTPNSTVTNTTTSTPSNRAFDFLRPRREKTESVIWVRNSATRQLLLEKLQQVKALEHKKNLFFDLTKKKSKMSSAISHVMHHFVKIH